jgi:hypothetical protein
VTKPFPSSLVRALPGALAAQGGALGLSGWKESSKSITATIPNTRTLHTSQGLLITRSTPALERDYSRDPVARMQWNEKDGWTNPREM